MKDAIKLILELISLGKVIYKSYKKEKNAKKKKAIKKAVEKRDLDKLRDLILSKPK